MSVLLDTVPRALNTIDLRQYKPDVVDESITNPRSQNNSNLISPGQMFTFNTGQSQTYRFLPIIAGVLVPLAVLLSIPSLTSHWGARPDGTAESRPNPLLVVPMSLSMACGVLANICLVLRFAERSVEKMTLLCIIFLSINGSCLTPETFHFC